MYGKVYCFVRFNIIPFSPSTTRMDASGGKPGLHNQLEKGVGCIAFLSSQFNS